jgi:hypothetical protein
MIAPSFAERMNSDLTDWISYFLNAIVMMTSELVYVIEGLDNLPEAGAHQMVHDELALLDFATAHGVITIDDLETVLPDIFPRTRQRRLQRLVDHNMLIPHGEGRQRYFVPRNQMR